MLSNRSWVSNSVCKRGTENAHCGRGLDLEANIVRNSGNSGVWCLVLVVLATLKPLNRPVFKQFQDSRTSGWSVKFGVRQFWRFLIARGFGCACFVAHCGHSKAADRAIDKNDPRTYSLACQRSSGCVDRHGIWVLRTAEIAIGDGFSSIWIAKHGSGSRGSGQSN